jgi:hypothetical protein
MKSGSMKRPGRPAAFTLVEVLLTSMLTATLLAALWSLLAMYSKMFDTGQTKTEQSQLARTLLSQLSDDMHGIVQAPPAIPPMPLLVPATPSGAPTPSSANSKAAPAANNTPVTSASANNAAPAANRSPDPSPSGPTAPSSVNSSPPSPGASAVGNSSSNGATPSPATRNFGRNSPIATSSLRPSGLFGTENYLQIDVLQPAAIDPNADASLPPPADQPPASRAAELRTVVYAFEELRDLPLSEPRMLLTRREMPWERAHPSARGRAGRAGRQSRSSSATQPMAAKGVPLQAPATQGMVTPGIAADAALDGFDDSSTVSVPEVMQFRLRYFDGSVWTNQWDSVAQKRLPAAIEVSMHLRSFDEPDPLAAGLAEPIGEELGTRPKLPVYRLVIQLPDAADVAGGHLPPGRRTRPNAARTLGANANARP